MLQLQRSKSAPGNKPFSLLYKTWVSCLISSTNKTTIQLLLVEFNMADLLKNEKNGDQ